MKKTGMILPILFCCAALMLSACGKNPTEEKPGEDLEPVPEENTVLAEKAEEVPEEPEIIICTGPAVPSAQELADGPHKYLSVYQIRRALNHLVDEGMLQLGRYNKKGYDRTYWYTLTKKAEDLLHLCEMDASYLQDASNK